MPVAGSERVRRKDSPASAGFLALIVILCAVLPRCNRIADVHATPGPPRGGSLSLAQHAPASLDPADVESVYESLPVNQIFDGLVDVDSSLAIVPGLARSWTVSRDARIYTLELRPGVRFHDGTPLEAQDVVFTFRRLLSPERRQENVACGYLTGVRGAQEFAAGRSNDLPGVEAIDATTVRITLDRPYPSFLEVLAMDGLRVVPRAVVTRLGSAAFARAPVGTGPFQVAFWDAKRLTLVANRSYFGGEPRLDEIRIELLGQEEADNGAERFHSGDLDLLEVTASQLPRLSGDEGVRLVRFPEMSLTFLGFDTTRPHLRDLRIRQAIAHAVNREAVLDGSHALGRRALGILPPGLTGYLPHAKALEHDPARARELLKEAGYPGGAGLPPLELYSAAGSSSTAATVAALEADLAAVGIRVASRPVPWEEMTARVDDRRAPAFLLTWVADLSDPDAFLRTLFQSGAPANYFGFRDRETDRLMEEGALEMNPVLRARIYGRLEERLLQSGPLVPLYHSVGVLALRREIHGLDPGPLGLANASFEEVWRDRPEGRS